MIKVDRNDQSERRLEDDDEEHKVSDRRCEEAKAMLPRIYQGVSHGTRLLSTYFRAFPNQLAHRKAFSSYNDLRLITSHAAFQDTLAALKRQENANITFQFSEYSELHNLRMCEDFGQKLAEALCTTSYKGIMQLFIFPGRLDFHTTAPSRRWALEKSALMIG